MTTNDLMLSRRQALGLGAAALASLGLVACDSEEAPTGTPTGEDASEEVQLDAAAYDELVASGPVADDETIAASTWATAVRDAGVLRVGGVQTSMLFSLLNEEDGHTRGFDAGLSQLLTRYILGDESKQELTQVTSDTRESVLQNDQVDTVFATYSINDDRKQVISFAGPYYTTQQSILVMADNTDINSVDDLAGRNVAAQSGSTGPSILEEYAPEANVQEFSTDEEARTVLSRGPRRRLRDRHDDADGLHDAQPRPLPPGRATPLAPSTPTASASRSTPTALTSSTRALQQIEDEGLWADLWQVCIGDRAGIDDVPEPPAIGA